MWSKITNYTRPGIYAYRQQSNPEHWEIIIIRSGGEIVFKFGDYPTSYTHVPDDSEIAEPKDVLHLK